MAVQALESDFPNDRLPLLRWLMFTGVCVFGFVLVWYFGLFRLMVASDKTYISAIIVALYLATCVHCFLRTAVISREPLTVAALVGRGVTASCRRAGVVTSRARPPPGQGPMHPQPHFGTALARASPHRPDPVAARICGCAARPQPARFVR
jgi:hypothetical protein